MYSAMIVISNEGIWCSYILSIFWIGGGGVKNDPYKSMYCIWYPLRHLLLCIIRASHYIKIVLKTTAWVLFFNSLISLNSINQMSEVVFK